MDSRSNYLNFSQVYHDLLRSEEDFVNEMRHMIENYVRVFEDPSTPDAIRHLKEPLTLNLRELYNFHANVLLKGLQYYSDDPGKVGQTFVRLERDFDLHVKYCRDEAAAIKLLDESPAKEFFDVSHILFVSLRAFFIRSLHARR
uniref:DH domain-containing protein n=1 Tax=Plectus sambesii TaxID=2011161 RepID=A0A914V3R6_9BILA